MRITVAIEADNNWALDAIKDHWHLECVYWECVYWDRGRPARNEREARKWNWSVPSKNARLKRVAGETPAVQQTRRLQGHSL